MSFKEVELAWLRGHLKYLPETVSDMRIWIFCKHFRSASVLAASA